MWLSLVGGAGVERVDPIIGLVSYSEFVVNQIERVRERYVMTLRPTAR